MVERRVLIVVPVMLLVAVATGCKSAATEKPPAAAAKPDPAAAKREWLARNDPHQPPASQPATAPSLAPPLEQTWRSGKLKVTSEATAVAEGPAPLFYITQGAGVFRVVDRTTGETLAEMFAGGRTVIRVDDRYGVVFGKETLLKGPRPAGHRYAFYLQPDTTNEMRQGWIRPKQ